MSKKDDSAPKRSRRPLALGLGVLIASTLALAAYIGSTGGANAKAGNPHQGAKIASAHCAACHGTDGNSADPHYPKLAGQKAAYLYRELWAFKQGQRQSAPMQALVAPLSDTELADVSAFYATQAIHSDPVSDPGLMSTGEQIYYAGHPSCAMCHQGGGMPMMRMMGSGAASDAPKLEGQHALYILQQLNAFASGQRRGTVMNQIAASLSETERKAVAEYPSAKH